MPKITLKVPLGQLTFNKKKTKLKLVKKGKREPRKAGFPWDLGLHFGQPIRCALLFQNMKF